MIEKAKEVVKEALSNREEALKMLQMMKERGELTDKEVRGLAFAFNSLPSLSAFDHRHYLSAKGMLLKIQEIPAVDEEDRIFAYALVSILDEKFSGIKEGDVKTVGDEPEDKSGDSSVGVKFASGRPAEEPADDDAQHIEE